MDAGGGRLAQLHDIETRFADPDAGIAFNRSWFAYSRNRDVTPVGYDDRAQAVDAVMEVLRFDPDDGGAAAMVSWFPLHGTCVHAENTRIHSDHKGLAAETFASNTGSFGIFAQGACGDVTSNYRLDEARGKVVGRFDDDYETAAWVGSVEADHARRTFDAGGGGAGMAVEGEVSSALRYVDFGAAPIELRYAEQPDAPPTTRPAQLGISMALGTAEGPGPLYPVAWIARLLNGMARVKNRLQNNGRRHDPQWPMLDLAAGLEGRLGGVLPLRSPLLVAVDPRSESFAEIASAPILCACAASRRATARLLCPTWMIVGTRPATAST